MNMNLHALTNTFGLSQPESEVFEHLLQYGSIKAVELRKILHLDRTPFYRALSSLETKNLILIKGDLRKQTVALQSTISIEHSLEQKSRELSAAKESLANLAANMQEIRDSRYHRDNVEIYSGPNAYLDSMLSLLKGGGKLLRDITPDSATLYRMAGDQAKYQSIIKTFKAERLRKNISIRILFDNRAKDIDALSAADPQTLKESRRYDGNLKLDCYLNTCGSRSLFYTKDATGSWGIIIKDPLIANLLNSLFDVVWKLSKPL